MKKFLTGLKYGTWSTRLYVISIPIAFLIGIGAVVASFIINQMFLFLGGVAVVIGGIALILNYNIEESYIAEERSIQEEEPDNQTEAEVETETIRQKEKKQKENRKKEQKPKREQKSKEEQKLKKEQKPKKEHKPKKEQISEEPEEENTSEKSGIGAEKSEIEAKESEDLVDESDLGTAEESEEEAEVQEEDSITKESEKETREEELLSYDEKSIKQVFYKYKVKKDHKTIMIDSWEEKGIKQRPAYIWTVRGQMHVLTIGMQVDEYTIPLSKLGTLLYKKGVICQAKEEYPQFRTESLVSKVFSPYLPTYHEGNKDHRPVIYKNLFAFENGLTITNTSVKTVISMIHPQINVDDIVTRDVRFNDFFKEIYKLGTLFREQIYTVKEYQSKVNDVLQNFADSGIAREEYENTLRLLYQNKLITQEYIGFYLQYFEKNQMKMIEEGSKKRKKKKR